MALYQIVCMCILFACCGAQYIPYVDPQYDPNPAYSFTYNVNDPVTGDAKSQTESRQGDFVQGEYSLIEPDGSLRSVQYTAAPGVGFNAVVSKTPGAAPPNDRLIRGGYAGGRYPYAAPVAVPLAYRGAYPPVAPFY